MPRIPRIVGVMLRGDAWHVRKLRVQLRLAAETPDWKGRTGLIRTDATRKARDRRRSDLRLQTVFAEFDGE